MAYKYDDHKSVHEYTTKSNYVLELLKLVYFDSANMYQFDWPTHIDSFMPTDTDWDDYRDKVQLAQGRVDAWAEKVRGLLEHLTTHVKTNHPNIDFSGIKVDYNKFSSLGFPYYKPGKPKPIHIINITFKSEEARLLFAEYLSKQGYYETIFCFTEVPRRGKKDLIPTG